MKTHPARTPFPPAVRDRIAGLLADAKRSANEADWPVAWSRLEDAHVLSQPWIRPHLRVHARMLAVGWNQRDSREVVGQLSRLVVAGPGSASGRYPVGNTGRSRVSAFRPMQIRDGLAELLDHPPTGPPHDHEPVTS